MNNLTENGMEVLEITDDERTPKRASFELYELFKMNCNNNKFMLAMADINQEERNETTRR